MTTMKTNNKRNLLRGSSRWTKELLLKSLVEIDIRYNKKDCITNPPESKDSIAKGAETMKKR